MKNFNIEFKLANKNDVKKLIEVQSKSFYEDYVRYGECPSYNEPEDRMLDLIENVIVYKILKDNEIIGDIIIRKREDNKYYLRTFSVIPKCQNLGIGQKALKYIDDVYKDAAEWTLITPFKSYRNHHLYEKMGFAKYGEYRHSDVLTMFQYRKQK